MDQRSISKASWGLKGLKGSRQLNFVRKRNADGGGLGSSGASSVGTVSSNNGGVGYAEASGSGGFNAFGSGSIFRRTNWGEWDGRLFRRGRCQHFEGGLSGGIGGGFGGITAFRAKNLFANSNIGNTSNIKDKKKGKSKGKNKDGDDTAPYVIISPAPAPLEIDYAVGGESGSGHADAYGMVCQIKLSISRCWRVYHSNWFLLFLLIFKGAGSALA
jgi:hypothetical protein